MWHGAIETHLLYHATNSTPSNLWYSDSGRLNFRLDGAVKEHFIWFLFCQSPSYGTIHIKASTLLRLGGSPSTEEEESKPVPL